MGDVPLSTDGGGGGKDTKKTTAKNFGLLSCIPFTCFSYQLEWWKSLFLPKLAYLKSLALEERMSSCTLTGIFFSQNHPTSFSLDFVQKFGLLLHVLKLGRKDCAHRLNMELDLQILLGLLCTTLLLG